MRKYTKFLDENLEINFEIVFSCDIWKENSMEFVVW